MKKEINLIYRPVTDTDSEEARRRVEAVFDMLFEEIFKTIHIQTGQLIYGETLPPPTKEVIRCDA